MKKNLLWLSLLSITFICNAGGKLSPYSQSFLSNYQSTTLSRSASDSNSGLNERNSKLYLGSKSLSDIQEKPVGIIIELNAGADINDVINAGAFIDYSFGNAYTAHAFVGDIETIANLEGVKRVSIERPIFLKNDKARNLTKVDVNHAGTGLSHPFKGDGVIYGTVDSGFDFNHLAFQDEDGNTRIKSAYLFGRTGGTAIPGTGVDGNKYAGSVYTTATQIASLTTDDSSESHGTHTAGIGAGSYSGNSYYGMAPESDLILCAGSLTDLNILNGVKYVMDYATEHNQPAVVNLSLGSNTGAHDGTDYFTQILSNLTGKGKIVAISAGNEGGDPLYLNKKFTSSTDEIKSFVATYDGSSTLDGYFDLWSRNSTPIGIQVVVYDMTTNKLVYESEVYKSSSSFKTFTLNSSSDSKFKTYYTGKITLYTELSSDNNKYNCWTDFSVKLTSSSQTRYRLGFVFTGEAGAEMDCWIDDYYNYFSSEDVAGWEEGSTDCSINSMVATDAVISVGAYSSRNSFKNTSNSTISTNLYGTLYDIAYFSSYGPDLAGGNRPDIVAPGHIVISAVNGYDSSTVGSSQYLAASITKNGKKNCWASMSGTSMSCPVVAGIIAQWLQADPNLDALQIREIFNKTAIKDSYVTKGDARKWGAGKIDANAGLVATIQSGVEGVVKENNAVILYPNPSNGQFTLLAEGETTTIELEIYNTNGQQVVKRTLDASNGAIEVNVENELKSGLYIVKVIGEKVNYTSRLIMK